MLGYDCDLVFGGTFCVVQVVCLLRKSYVGVTEGSDEKIRTSLTYLNNYMLLVLCAMFVQSIFVTINVQL